MEEQIKQSTQLFLDKYKDQLSWEEPKNIIDKIGDVFYQLAELWIEDGRYSTDNISASVYKNGNQQASGLVLSYIRQPENSNPKLIEFVTIDATSFLLTKVYAKKYIVQDAGHPTPIDNSPPEIVEGIYLEGIMAEANNIMLAAAPTSRLPGTIGNYFLNKEIDIYEDIEKAPAKQGSATNSLVSHVFYQGGATVFNDTAGVLILKNNNVTLYKYNVNENTLGDVIFNVPTSAIQKARCVISQIYFYVNNAKYIVSFSRTHGVLTGVDVWGMVYTAEEAKQAGFNDWVVALADAGVKIPSETTISKPIKIIGYFGLGIVLLMIFGFIISVVT